MPHDVPSAKSVGAVRRPGQRGLTVRLRGSHLDEGLVRLADFLGFFKHVQTTLTHVDRIVSKGQRTADYVIVDLQMGSAAAEILPVPRPSMPDVGDRISGGWLTAVRTIEVDGQRPEGFDDEALEAFGKLSRQLGKAASGADVSYGGSEAEITPKMEAAVESILGETTSALGSVSGSLDAINAHDTHTFYIYPAIAPRRVTCRFPKAMLPEAGAALTQHVTVEGTMHYRAGDALPRSVDVQRLILHPPNAELPTLASMRGSVPSITGGMTSVEFIRSLRDAK